MSEEEPTTITGRLRKASVSAADAFINSNPQPGMWAATGTAIAYAPNLPELREPIGGGENIKFDGHGRSTRTYMKDEDGTPVLNISKTATRVFSNNIKLKNKNPETVLEKPTLQEQAQSGEKHNWRSTTKHGFTAAWKFVLTPTGFLMTIYGLNVVGWGAMIFFLLLDAAPAMDHPSKDALESPRKKWIEIDSQILNALFCVTGFGLAPWRFRDLYWLLKVRVQKDNHAMGRLCEQNCSWYRPPPWYHGEDEDVENGRPKRVTFTGKVAPTTAYWKLAFVVWMMVWNTLFQGVLSGFMWGFNRFDRPSWSTGVFVGCGCGVALAAGVMTWWEGRKVKKIEGPIVKVIEAVETTDSEKQRESTKEAKI